MLGDMVRFVLKTTIFSVAIFGIGATSSFAQSAELKQAVTEAFSYTDIQRFDDALAILSRVSEADQQHVQYGLTRARILTWSQKFPAAEVEFQRLMDVYPNNPDIMVSYGYLQLFDGKPATAEQYFSVVLRDHPDYMDAFDGLQRAQKLQRERKSVFDSGYQLIENITN